jgi:hypothetical protein
LLLQAQAKRIVDGSELDNGDQIQFATDSRGFTRIKISNKSKNSNTEAAKENA